MSNKMMQILVSAILAILEEYVRTTDTKYDDVALDVLRYALRLLGFDVSKSA